MAKISRATHTVFGGTGPSSAFAQAGSLVAGSPEFTKDIATIQALPAWNAGIQAMVYPANKAILLEDLNSIIFEHSTQVAYILQEGLPEWDPNTTYYEGSVVQDNIGGAQWYVALQTSTGQTPPSSASNTYWQWVNPPVAVMGATLAGGAVPKISASAPGTGPGGSQAIVASAISDNGTNVAIGLPLKYPDGTTQGTAASPITNVLDVTATRSLNTIFQNTTGKTMTVLVTIGGSNSGGIFFSATALVGAANPPTMNLGNIGATGNGNAQGMLTLIVLPGYYYKVAATAGTIDKWIECY